MKKIIFNSFKNRNVVDTLFNVTTVGIKYGSVTGAITGTILGCGAGVVGFSTDKECSKLPIPLYIPLGLLRIAVGGGIGGVSGFFAGGAIGAIAPIPITAVIITLPISVPIMIYKKSIYMN